MNTNEIVRALRICNNPKGHRCSECPVFSRYEYRVCKATVDRTAAALIESQAAEIKRYSDTGLTPEEITANMEMFAAYRRVCGGKSPDEVTQAFAENARLRTELAEQQRETASCDYLLGEADIGARAAGGEIKELKTRLELVERERDKAVEDMKVGWLCRACIKRVKGKEWCNCPAVNFVNGPEKTTTCDNFEWRGTEGKA